jgi:hypothetical protein
MQEVESIMSLLISTENMTRKDISMFLTRTKNTQTFPVLLDKLRDEKGLTPAEHYSGALVDRRLYSKIMRERHYHPAKNTVLALGLALKLSLDEMRKLLESAGFSLSRSIVSDLIIMFCIENRLYDLHDVNALLVEAGQKTLCGK